MVLLTLLAFSTLFISCSAQQLIKLSSFKGLRVHNEINVEAPFVMYVSAQSDYDSILRQIFFVTEDGSTPLLYLARDDGEIRSFTVKKSVYLTTTLNDDVMKTLNGVIFINSKKQFADRCLRVYNIYSETRIGNNNYGLCLHLFLNTSFNKYVISEWKQDPTSYAYIFAGIPQGSQKPENTKIFSNPVHTNQGNWYFRYVNDFSLYMTAFYVDPLNDVYFTIDQQYYPNDKINGSWTRGVTSTGFYMKPLGSDDGTTIVNIKRDTNYTGFSGANVVGNLPDGGSVTVGFYDNGTKYEHTVTPSTSFTPWTIPYIERTFQISSDNGKDGEYYVQYFVSQGLLKESTVTPPSTLTAVPVVVQTTTQSMIQTTSKSRIQTTPSSRIQTTTKSVGVVRLVLSMATLMMFWL